MVSKMTWEAHRWIIPIAPPAIPDSLVVTGLSIVYLTATPTLEATDPEMEIVEQEREKDEPPIVSERWLRPHDDVPMARFTVHLRCMILIWGVAPRQLPPQGLSAQSRRRPHIHA
jgi:hypothetical protein